jgi:hypothetical protein
LKELSLEGTGKQSADAKRLIALQPKVDSQKM